MQQLYPELKPYREFFLSVTHGHSLYVALCGNPQGIPVVVMHGGPGGGCGPSSRRFFDPNDYHIILMDQRGAGRSLPHASLEANTTQHLISDFEALRRELGISKWLLFGGSWGTTLALAYAQAHPDQVSGLILRGIFLGRPKDVDWLYETGGASRMFADYWKVFQKPLLNTDAEATGQMVNHYYQLLCGADELKRFAAAKAWATWEGSIATLHPNPHMVEDFADAHFALALARIECHYFVNQCFLSSNQLLENMHKISHLPGIIVHGRYDVICPAEQAFEVHELWEECQLHIVRDAGHAQQEPGIVDNLIKATREFAVKYA
ncbi:prolyl aminopeptidase [Candidatus Njordibacter sp. Uisw_039]|jgi:proline iminopeptidase|uniref:prolyl aminopeptidase n=1 Tax=Candidatus Njordibacter sp. Uisw_039 TaxID=3230972 RepID=UPI003A13212C|tara:strand:- start:206 stop:1168 length:963 start_codon:yes stop_codon:yes gene_type:complete